MWLPIRELLQEIEGARNCNVQASAAIQAVCHRDFQRFTPSSCTSHRLIAFARARRTWNSRLSSSKWSNKLFFFLHLAFRACVSYMSALMPSTRLCFWNICLSFSEPNHSLATLRAYRNSHQAKSTMSDLGKKKPGGTWYCRPYCDASVDLGFIVMLTFALLCFIKAKKRGGTWRARSWICQTWKWEPCSSQSRHWYSCSS